MQRIRLIGNKQLPTTLKRKGNMYFIYISTAKIADFEHELGGQLDVTSHTLFMHQTFLNNYTYMH